jgi:hypothetical protein
MYYSIVKSILLKTVAVLFVVASVAACSEDSMAPDVQLDSETVSYQFNEGQLLDNVDTAYRGEHERNLSAEILIEEMENGNAAVSVTLNNTISGEDYPVHVHDAADPSSTPNGTPYNETPNAAIFAGAISGNGGTVTMTNETSVSYMELLNQYEGFFVVHDPTQEISTVDLTTYLVLGVFGQTLPAGEPELRSSTFNYDFNEGQLLDDPNTAYDGDHQRNLTATMVVEEQFNGKAMITVTLENTLDGFDYPVHSHDAADPSTTPNGTPYNETPNSDILAAAVAGNGGSASVMVETMETDYLTLINDYEGFFVVHDPTQAISTTDLTTYLNLGQTAR